MARSALKAKQSKHRRFLVRKHTRCNICGRARAVLRKFLLCRICLRTMVHKGIIPGVRKASW